MHGGSRSPAPPDFNRLARVYRWLEYFSFGPMLARCRFRYLDECTDLRHVLILGDGDGRFTARLLSANLAVRITAVDGSPAMLAELRRRVQALDPHAKMRLLTIEADMRAFTPEGLFDGIVTHFSLDCLTEPEIAALIRRIAPHLKDGARWIVSEFAVPEPPWKAAGARLLIGCLYLAFRKMTGLGVRKLPDHAHVLQRNGFRRLRSSRLLGGLLVAEIWIFSPVQELRGPAPA